MAGTTFGEKKYMLFIALLKLYIYIYIYDRIFVKIVKC